MNLAWHIGVKPEPGRADERDVMTIDVPSPDGPKLTPELVLVGAGVADDTAGDHATRAAPQRRPPLPTLHLAAHEIIRFRAPERDPEPA